jgi:hypothetical protein
MPDRLQRFIVARVFLGVLFVLMAALQIRFTAVTAEVITDATGYPAIPQIETTALAFDTPGKSSAAAGIRKAIFSPP